MYTHMRACSSFFLQKPHIVPADATRHPRRIVPAPAASRKTEPSISICLFLLQPFNRRSFLKYYTVVCRCAKLLCVAVLLMLSCSSSSVYIFQSFLTNHFMLSESLTILDIAWPLFQAVRSLVPSSYVIFLQTLRS